jgi:hypothetical protein
MVRSFQFYGWGASGEPEQFNKGSRDPSHYTDTCYALYPWENHRGTEAAYQLTASEAMRNLAALEARRRGMGTN